MKLTIFVFFLGLMSLSASTYSQKTRLSLDLNKVSIEEALRSIENISEFVFIYENETLKQDKKVSLKVNDSSVDKILERIFKDTEICYEIAEKQVILTKRSNSELPVKKSPVSVELELIQKKKLTGTVYDEDGKSIPGASVVVKGTTRGIITDADGGFQIDVEPASILLVSFIGYQTQEIPVKERSTIHITLKAVTEEIEDVTVVAFAKQKKESVIASVTTVKPAELKIPSSNLTTALAGRVAGMISYQRSGEPGQDNAQFFIRGVTTFGYKKDPLILIDNNEVTTSELARLQPDDIASFSIMKDATATALYGSRGANGVILVTTKEGHEGKMEVKVRFEESISKPTSMVKLADPVTYMRLHNEAILTRDPLGETLYTQNKIDNTLAGGNPYVYPANDWYKALFRDQTINQRLNFSLSGGSKSAAYFLSGSVINDNGILKVDKQNNFNNNIDLKRYMLRSNVNLKMTPSTEAVIRLQGNFDDYTGPIDGGTALFNKVMKTNPVLFPAYFKPDAAHQNTQHILFGNYDLGQYTNPYADMTKGYRDQTTSQMLAQIEFKQGLDFITKGLFWRAMVNTNRYADYGVSRYYTPYYYKVMSYDKPTDEYQLAEINPLSGTEYLDYNEGDKYINSTIYLESALSWNRKFQDKHDLSGLLVYTMREELKANTGDLQKSLPYRNLGLAGRATYAYDSRYFGEFNFGYNGSERFSKKERFGFFPSCGLGWIVSNEGFWSDGLKRTINKLKFKATYGLVGNDAIGSSDDRFFYLSKVNMDDANYKSSFGTYGGYTKNGVSVSRYPNDEITWETAKKLNLGLELGLWNDLEIQADVFHEYRYNILMTRSYIPLNMGLQAAPRANVGEAVSKGVDISLNYNHSFSNGFWVTSMANFTYATSEFKVYEEPDYAGTPWKSKIGRSLNQSWGYVAERLFVDEYEVNNSPAQFGQYMAGDIKYKDINKDGRISDLDQVPVGYPTSPEIVYGFGFSAGYKGFDFSCFFQGLARESFWINTSSTAPFIDNQNALLKAYADNHWSEEKRDIYALWPRLSNTIVSNNNQTSTWFMRDGSFLRLKSLEFGYSLPQKLLDKAKMGELRVYFSGTNLLTFSKFKLWDPEMGGNGLGYPIQKVFNIGLQITL